MGGGRCHFQDCRQKNDGVIHMFRFPVFDKIRCHRWLVASGRMDFLKLKVSQVRNKQICQYHFRDEDFMNAKKNSLKPAAIPLLAGPFCMELNEQDELEDMPLTEDQIENEVMMPKDIKPESLNLKLHDYLTTSELEGFNESVIKPEKHEAISPFQNLSKHWPMKNKIVIIKQEKGIKNLGQVVSAANMAQSPTPIKILPPKMSTPKNINVQEILQDFEEKPFVKILSQKTVSSVSNLIHNTPIKLAELKVINPASHVIGDKIRNTFLKNESIEVSQINEKENSLLKETTQISDNIPIAPVSSQSDNNIPNIVDKLNPPSLEDVKVSKPALQNTQQASKDIQEKRKFNKRLRDIIRESIDMADSRTPKKESKSLLIPIRETMLMKESVPPSKLKDTKRAEQLKDTSRVEPLIAISQLQNRLQTMESLLLNRIDANTKEVFELKKLLLEKNKAEKEMGKQENQIIVETSHEERKKRLFSEVSEYLSKEGKSALYEQLFVSKYPKRTRR